MALSDQFKSFKSRLANAIGALNSKMPWKSKVDGNVVDTPQPQAPVNAAPQQSEAPEQVFYIYSHGFTNGVYEIDADKDTFEKYLEASNTLDYLEDQKVRKEEVLSELKGRLAEWRANQDTFKEAVFNQEGLINGLNSKVAERKSWVQEREEHAKSLRQLIPQNKAEYAWVPALVYLIAGIAFIAGDVTITKQITSWGFDMGGMEGLIFATGLAFTAFLFKPLIDRLLEKPFQSDQVSLKPLYRNSLLVITSLGVLMLFFLGKFRSASQAANLELEELNNTLMSQQAGTREYNNTITAIQKVNTDLSHNSMGEWGIILSGIVFAIGGALCLAVAFPSLTRLINRYWIVPVRIKKVNAEIRKGQEALNSSQKELDDAIAEKNKSEEKLKMRDVEALEQKIEALEEERKQLMERYFEVRFKKEVSLYYDGKNRGEKYHLEGDLVYKVMDTDPSSPFLNGLGKTKGEDDEKKTSRTYTRRPFVKIRKMIADNYKNQNLASDGTDFEILS